MTRLLLRASVSRDRGSGTCLSNKHVMPCTRQPRLHTRKTVCSSATSSSKRTIAFRRFSTTAAHTATTDSPVLSRLFGLLNPICLFRMHLRSTLFPCHLLQSSISLSVVFDTLLCSTPPLPLRAPLPQPCHRHLIHPFSSFIERSLSPASPPTHTSRHTRTHSHTCDKSLLSVRILSHSIS